jgi:hypothetical protein
MKQIFVLIAVCLLVGCNTGSKGDKVYTLQGAWVLLQMDRPVGYTEKYSEATGTQLRLYDGDSLMQQCWLTRTESGLIIRPVEQTPVRLIDKGHGEYLYLEGDDPRPLTLADDSTLVIQRNGVLYTWRLSSNIATEWGTDIREIMAADLARRDDEREQHSYVLSPKERRQANVIHGFIFSTIGIVVLLLLIARIAYDSRKDKRKLQLQLQQIQEVQRSRPQVVRKAIESVEATYFRSDEYLTLQKRIGTGLRMKDDDWQNIEGQVRRVYPGFISQLRNLHAMSELEYQVCLLVKLRIAPSDIAAVLARDVSTISTVRSRLYKKVFDRKGGAKEWDEFILSIGA